jgi:hypothetical protein
VATLPGIRRAGDWGGQEGLHRFLIAVRVRVKTVRLGCFSTVCRSEDVAAGACTGALQLRQGWQRQR